MKKISIFFAAALALGFASCDDKSDLGVMQTNPQLGLMEADGIKVKYGADFAGSSLNLNDYVNKEIKVIELVEAAELPEGATVEYTMEVSPYADFHDSRTLAVTNGAVKCNDWEEAILNMIGKTPLPVDNYVRFAVYGQTTNDLVRFGGPDFFYASKEVKVTPIDQKLPIENSYTLEYAFENENTVHQVVLNHSAQHPYDDPMFTTTIEITAAQAEVGGRWCIVSESGKRYGVADTSDPTELSGNLMVDGAQGVITESGTVKFEANMLDLRYEIIAAPEYLYTPGPANGWGFENNMLLTTNNYVDYYGFVYIQEQYKLCGQPDWSPKNWGTSDGVNLVQDGPNITVSENGLYYVTVNLNALTFNQTLITRVGLIGGFNGWGSDEAMTPSEDFKTWKATLTVAEAGPWKFRMNDGWDINLGGSIDNLVPGGDNLEFAAAGTYEITLNLGSLPYTCTVTAK